MADAIQRAGTLDKDKGNEAIGKTDLLTIGNRVRYDEFHFSQFPLAFGQWFKTDKAYKWNGRRSFQSLISSRLRPDLCSQCLTNKRVLINRRGLHCIKRKITIEEEDIGVNINS